MTTLAPSVTDRIIEIIRAELVKHRMAHNVPEVTPDSAFEADLHCDPIDMICILNAVEETMLIDVPDATCETVADLARLVEGV